MSATEEDVRGQAPPAGGGFPARTIAALLELTERRLQQLVAEGWIPKPARGMYSLKDSVRGYIRYLKQHSRDNTRGSETARLARAQSVRVEMENFRRMGELAVWPQIDELLKGLVQKVRSEHNALPGRISSELAAITQPTEIYQRLQSELRAVDDICADHLEECAEALGKVPQPGSPVEAFDAPDPDELGGSESEDAAGLSGAGEVPQ